MERLTEADEKRMMTTRYEVVAAGDIAQLINEIRYLRTERGMAMDIVEKAMNQQITDMHEAGLAIQTYDLTNMAKDVFRKIKQGIKLEHEEAANIPG